MKTQQQFTRIVFYSSVLSAWRDAVAEAAPNPCFKQQLLQREAKLGAGAGQGYRVRRVLRNDRVHRRAD
jgi:hypothetical protein